MEVKLKKVKLIYLGDANAGDTFIYNGKLFAVLDNTVLDSAGLIVSRRHSDDDVACFDFENNAIVTFEEDTEVQSIKLEIKEV